MKFQSIVTYLGLIASACSVSLDSSHGKQSNSTWTSTQAHSSLPTLTLEPRDIETCIKIAEIIISNEKYATGSIYGLGSAAVAKAVCYGRGHSAETCNSFALGVFGAVLIAFASQVEDRKQAVEVQRFSLTNSRQALLLRTLQNEGDTFDKILNLPIAAYPRHRRTVEETYVVEHFEIQRLRIENATMDLTIKYYNDGKGQILINPDLISEPRLSTSSSKDDNKTLLERNLSGGPGFKFNFVTVEKAKLKRPDQIKFARAITDSWRRKTVDGNFREWFGFVKHGHKANFYMRIQPEDHKFDNNYESVDRCGRLSQFL